MLKFVCKSMVISLYNFCTSTALFTASQKNTIGQWVQTWRSALFVQVFTALKYTYNTHRTNLLIKSYAPFTQRLLPIITKYLNKILMSSGSANPKPYLFNPGGSAL